MYPSPSLSYNDCIGGVCNTTEEFFILSGLNYSTNYIINVSASNCAGTGSIASTSMELISGDFNFVKLLMSLISFLKFLLVLQEVLTHQYLTAHH